MGKFNKIGTQICFSSLESGFRKFLRRGCGGGSSLYTVTLVINAKLPTQLNIINSSLVVEHDVWSPDVVAGHVEHLDPAVLLGVPLQLVVAPVLLHPQVGRHDLVLQVLKLPMVS